jgi:hypothetical protein
MPSRPVPPQDGTISADAPAAIPATAESSPAATAHPADTAQASTARSNLGNSAQVRVLMPRWRKVPAQWERQGRITDVAPTSVFPDLPEVSGSPAGPRRPTPTRAHVGSVTERIAPFVEEQLCSIAREVAELGERTVERNQVIEPVRRKQIREPEQVLGLCLSSSAARTR